MDKYSNLYTKIGAFFACNNCDSQSKRWDNLKRHIDESHLAYVNGLKEINMKPKIDLKLWTEAYAWAKLNVRMNVTESDMEVVYKIPSDPAKPDVIDQNLDWNTFDQFKKNNFACQHVSLTIHQRKLARRKVFLPRLFLKI